MSMQVYHVEQIIDKMFEIAGHQVRFDDVRDLPNWWTDYTMTEEENKQWKKWIVKYLLDEGIVLNKQRAEKNADWLDLAYGLKISPES